MITHYAHVLMGHNNTCTSPKIKCNDTGVNLRIFPEVAIRLSRLREKRDPYNIPTGSTAVLKIAKKDKTYVLTDGEISDNSIFFSLPPQACTVVGEAKAEVNIFGKDGRRVTSGTFLLEITEEAINGHSEDSSDHVDILADYIDAVKLAKSATEKAATAAKEAENAAKEYAKSAATAVTAANNSSGNAQTAANTAQKSAESAAAAAQEAVEKEMGEIDKAIENIILKYGLGGEA